MKLSEVKAALQQVEKIVFTLPNGDAVPKHFHVTEVGKVSKHFIDCGGTVRQEERINFQLWSANDVYHRLKPSKLLGIIAMAEKTLQLGDEEIEVEYQGQTIEKFGLNFNGTQFELSGTQTDCLAKDKCLPEFAKPIVKLKELATSSSCCTPGGGCC